MNFEKVLALSPHTDDAELGAGGTLAKLVEEGSEVTVFAFSAPKKILETEFQNSLETLKINESKIHDFETRKFKSSRQEILEILYEYNQENKPDLVLTPSQNDLHQDHQVITNEAMRAFKTSTILGYELPWNNIHFDQNCFVSLNKTHLEKKLKALRHYESQIDSRDYFEEDYLEGLLRTRGVKIEEKYAESFEVIRLILNDKIEI